MPIVAMVAIDLLDMAVLRLTLAPSQHHSPVGQEHGRTIPLADFAVAQLATPISTRLNGRFSIKEAYGCRRLDQRERLASNRAARPSAIDRQTSHVFGVNSTLPPLCAAFVIASRTSSKR